MFLWINVETLLIGMRVKESYALLRVSIKNIPHLVLHLYAELCHGPSNVWLTLHVQA